MSDGRGDIAASKQVELAISRLDSLWILPSVAAKLFEKLLQEPTGLSAPADIVESDAALSARIISLLGQEGISLPETNPALGRAIGKVSRRLVQDAVLSVEVVYDGLGNQPQQVFQRKELVLHNLTVACCSGLISEALSQRLDYQMCYLAGLLHDIGKMAIDKVMPKSFVQIAGEAKLQGVSLCTVEQKHLGLDHTIIGKRLAQKWHFPRPVILAIWLHHSGMPVLSEQMPEARIAQVVQLADGIARRCGIGESGSYDRNESIEQTAQSLGITKAQIERISGELSDEVDKRSKLLGLDLPDAGAAYAKAAGGAAIRLAGVKAKLQLENEQLQSAASHFEFIRDFLGEVNSASSVFDIAERFAVGWQRFYQTGPVCLYFGGSAEDKELAEQAQLGAVIVESLSESVVTYLSAPSDSSAVPELIKDRFEILYAGEYLNWLFEQLDVEFDISRTKLLPLLCGGRAVGVIVFEVRYPADVEQFRQSFKESASVAGAVLDIALDSSNQERFAEGFVQLLSYPKQAEQQAAWSGLVNYLAEMASGAAHELNNPLSVISGRVQLLAEEESDEKKIKILRQIKENTDEIAKIIEDLMSFAKPREPRPAKTDVKQLLDEAMQLAAQRAGIEKLDIQREIAQEVKEVFVDSAQIVSSIANIFSNALESYPEQSGSIEVIADMDIGGESVRLQITDHGCGMDARTVQRATLPFFSSQTAGRKRGMGLAYAERHIQLNGGSLNITSQPGSGTTVTILLPCK